MPAEGQRTVTLSLEDIEQLEQIRVKYALRSWPAVIRKLAEADLSGGEPNNALIGHVTRDLRGFSHRDGNLAVA